MDTGDDSYRRYLGGDDEGLTALVELYKDGLILYLNGYVKNIHLAEELAEETFFRLITKKPHFAGRSSFKSFLYAIGRNIAMDYLRRNARTADTPIEEVAHLLREEQELEQAYLQEERKRTLHRALDALSPAYRSILWLVYIEGFSNREASAALKMTDRQVRNLLYRAKQALRTKLEKEGITNEDF